MASETETTLYDVGGEMLPQPFKPGRFGHLGLFVDNLEKSTAFYADTLGFRRSDVNHFGPPEEGNGITFLAYGADHHAMVLIPTALGMERDEYLPRGVTVNQISFQVGTLEEVVNAQHAMQARDHNIFRIGRDMPGSNWAVYFRDPDGHMIEMFYGMEQIGWDGRVKPKNPFEDRFLTREAPALPQPSERDEIAEMLHAGADLGSGRRALDEPDARFDVGGVLIPRPFKVVRSGPIALFVEDIDAALSFYVGELGFILTEESSWQGHRTAYLRTGTEHHSIALVPLTLRSALGVSQTTTLLSYGMQVGSYRQLRNAVTFLEQQGCTFIDMPAALYPGIDYAAHFLDPDGHCIQLYYYMEQVGWDGRPRPASERRTVEKDWPETITALPDSHASAFQGPLG